MAKQRKLRVPESIDEAAKRQREIGALLAEVDEIEHETEIEVAKIASEAAKRISALNKKIVEGCREIRGFADKHWDQLTEGGKIGIVRLLDAGTIRRYTTPPSIVFGKDDQEKIIKWLEERRLEDYIRRKAEVNKETLGGDLPLARTIPDVSVVETEKFVVKPAGRTDRLECTIKSGRWKRVEAKKQQVGDEEEN